MALVLDTRGKKKKKFVGHKLFFYYTPVQMRRL